MRYFVEQAADADPEQLLWTLRDVVVPGTETSVLFICWAVVLLTNHVAVQERLQAEIDSVIGRQRLPSFDDLSQSVDCCVANKKLSYRRGTARCVVSIEILPIATQQCRNYVYDKS